MCVGTEKRDLCGCIYMHQYAKTNIIPRFSLSALEFTCKSNTSNKDIGYCKSEAVLAVKVLADTAVFKTSFAQQMHYKL
jgi:hypothetical protein